MRRSMRWSRQRGYLIVDEDMARILATGGAYASRELVRLHDLLLQHLPDERELRLGIASAIAEIGLNVLKPAFEAHPALEAEFDRRLKKYGVVT